MIKKQEFNKASKRLGLEVVHISEIDTQKSKIKTHEDTFYNTWSCVGFQAEALDPVSIGYGTCENNKNHQWIKPKGKDPIVRIMKKRGCDVVRKSYCADHTGVIQKTEGYVIPHAENSGICQLLKYGKYRPSVYYVYCCSPPAIQSIEKLKNNNYYPLEKNHVLNLPELTTDGWDSVGVALYFSGEGSIEKTGLLVWLITIK